MLLSKLLPRSLKLRMASVVVALVLGATVLATTAGLMFAERGMKETLGSQQFDQISAAARTLDERLQARQILLRTFAEDLPLAVRDNPALLSAWLEQRHVLKEQFSNVAAFDPNGQLLTSLRGGGRIAPRSVRERPYFQQTLTLGRGVISPPIRSLLTGNPVLLLTQPIFDSSGKLAYVMTGALDLGASRIFEEVALARLGSSGFIYIMTTDGILVSHPTRNRLLEHINARPGRNLATEAALKGFEGWMEAANKDGSKGIYAYKRLRSTNWIVGSRFPSDEAFVSIRQVRDRVVLVASALAILAGLVSWLAIRILLRPLGQLRRQANEVRTGAQASAVLQTARLDEIGELSGAIYELVVQRERATEGHSVSEKRAHTIADAMPALISYVDMDERYVFTNEHYRTLFGVDPQAMIGMTIEESVGRKSYASVREQIARVRAGEAVSFEHTTWGNSNRHAIAHFIPDKDSEGRMLGFYTFMLDITERKEAELRQAESEKRAAAASLAKSEFVANMSHEIRTPLNGVLGIAQLLAATRLTAEQKHFVSLIQTAGMSLLGVLNDVLDFSKIEAGRMELAPAPFNIMKVLDTIAAGMAIGGGEKPVQLLIHVDPALPLFWEGDAMRIQQVLSNMVGNAIKFTERGAVAVEVTCSDPVPEGPQRELSFTIRDTGIGIAASEKEHLFTAFSQADASTSRRYGGSGLGLAICRRIACLMGGRITLDSVVGQGSTFVFSVPLPTSAVPPDAGASAVAMNLIVTGAPSGIAPYVAFLLRGLGHAAHLAATPHEARTLLDAHAATHYGAIFVADPFEQQGSLEAQAGVWRGPATGTPALIYLMTTAQRRTSADVIDRTAHASVMLTPPTSVNIAQVLAGAAPHADDAMLATTQRPALGGRRILVVEDNELNQFVARSLLSQCGAQVVIASNGNEALEMLQRPGAGFDTVLMDIQMPGLDGFETTQCIRHDLGLDIPVYAMSAGVTVTEQDRCAAAGMDGFIAKPIDLPRLLATLAPVTTAGLRSPPSGAPSGKHVFDAGPLLALSAPDSAQRATMLATVERVVLEAPAKFAAVRQALASEERSAAAALLHGLRGSVGALGARRFAAATAALEAAVHDAGSRVPGERIELAAAELEATLTAARAWLADQRVRTRVAPSEAIKVDAGVIDAFAMLLERQSMQALSVYDGLRDYFASTLSAEDHAGLGAAVGTLDFATAAAILARQAAPRAS